MPKCRNCQREISRLDTDICPYCGVDHPLPANYETMDVTQNIKGLKEMNLYHAKSHKTASVLFMLLGWTGAPFFYLKETKKGVIALIVTLVLEAGVSLGLFFTVFKNVFAFVIPFAALFVFYFIWGIVFANKTSLKDGNGEFLR